MHLAASFDRDSRRPTITYIFTLSSFIDLSSPDTLSYPPVLLADSTRFLLHCLATYSSDCYFDITGGFLVSIGIPAIMTAASIHGDDDEDVSKVVASLLPINSNLE